MRVHITHYAVFREQAGRATELRVTEAETPAALYTELQREYGFTLDPEWVKVAINDAFSAMDHPLQDGDQVIFIPPVSGG